MFAYCNGNPIMNYDPAGTHALGMTCGDPTCPMCNPYRREFLQERMDWHNKVTGSKLIHVSDNGILIYAKNDDGYTPKSAPGIIVIDTYFYSKNPGVQVLNSYLYDDTLTQSIVVNFLLDYQNTLPGAGLWHRTYDDLMVEWKAHNDIYDFYPNPSCEHVDFDYEDRGTSYLGYWLKAIMRKVD